MNLGLLVALENANKVLSNIQRIFNTGPYGDPPLKTKISKIELRSDLSWCKLALEPKFHEPWTFGGFGKREQTNRPTRFIFYKNMNLVCVFVRVFRSHQKTQAHDILALGLLWPNLDHYEARFSKF